MMAERTPVKEALTKVADLSTKRNGQQWKICARVMKKYDKKVTSNNTLFFKVLLEDDSGKIEALTFGKENVERLFPLLRHKKVYYISKGKLKEVNQTFENVGHELEIYLNKTTTVSSCTNPADCPTTNSPYTPLCQLPAASNRFTDVLGQLTEIGCMETKNLRDGPTPLLKIQLTDNRDGCKVDVALWGQKAVEFKKIPVGKVIAIKNVKVNRYQGRLELSSTMNTETDYNPSDAEAYILRHHTDRPNGGAATIDKSEVIATSTAAGTRMIDVRRRLLVKDTRDSENMAKDEDSDESEDTITPMRRVRTRIESDTENEADEEKDEISHVQTRRTQMFQRDSDSESSEVKPSNGLRKRKRTSVSNIDSEEEVTFNSHKPDSDKLSGSSKKTFRRETIEYNPEDVLVASSDEEVSDVGSHNDDDSSNDSDTTAGDDGTSYESSRSDSDFEDSSFDDTLEEARKHPIFNPIHVVFQLIVLKAAGEEKEAQKVKQNGLEMIKSLDKQIESRLNLCQSQAWCERAATAIHRFPVFVKVSDRKNLPRGDLVHLDDCEVCTRSEHPWEYKVYFRGEPYNNLTFSQEDSFADEKDDLELCFKMGRFCFERTKVYHQLFHWKFHLYQRCKEKLSDVTLQKDKDRLLEELQTLADATILLETFNNVKKWMHRIAEDYTLDGKELRGNKRYLKEYGEKY